MRLAFRIDPIRFAPHAVLCAAIALIALPASVHAQANQAAAPTPSATLAESADTRQTAVSSMEAGMSESLSPLAGNAPNTSADAASVNDISLDDQMLSRQRGGAVGLVMVAATPQLMRGNGGGRVTLWDEIAPPSPLPIPVDAARSAQSNIAMYQRK